MKKVYGFAGSGGGAKGAWGAGVAHYLVHDLDREYNILSGTSTGALLMNLVALGETERLKKAYTNVTNKDIYTLAPYDIEKGQHGVFKTKMNYFKIAWNIFVRKLNTFGDSNKLREKLIPRFFTESNFNVSRKAGKELIACVTNLTKGKVEFKSSLEEDYEDFLDWVFTSTCAAPFMSIVEKDNCEYADGGYIEHIPLQILIDKGCTEIDVINHAAPDIDVEKIRNPLHLINRIIDITMKETSASDMKIAQLSAREKDVIINIYSPGRKLTNNSLVFDKETMLQWWDEGYEHAKTINCKTYKIYGDARKGYTELVNRNQFLT